MKRTLFFLLLLPGCMVDPFALPGRAPVAETQAIERARNMDAIDRLLEQEDFPGAKKELERLGAESHPRLFYARARILAHEGDLDGAALWLEKTLAESPQWIEPRLSLLRLRLSQERDAEVAEICQRLNELFPHHPAGPYGLGMSALKKNDAKEARRWFDEALRRDPEDPLALKARAAIAGMDRDAALQIRLLQRALAQDNEDPQGFLLLGDLERAAGRTGEAKRAYARSYQLAPVTHTALRLYDLARETQDQEGQDFWAPRAGLKPQKKSKSGGL